MADVKELTRRAQQLVNESKQLRNVPGVFNKNTGFNFINSATPNQRSEAFKLIGISLALILFFGYLAFNMANESKTVSLTQFLLGEHAVDEDGELNLVSLTSDQFVKTLLVGLAAGIVLGFMDNLFMFLGGDALEPFLPGGPLSKAGYANTFSIAVSSFLGSFVGFIVITKTGVSETPIIADALGVVIGSIIGIVLGRKITGKK